MLRTDYCQNEQIQQTSFYHNHRCYAQLSLNQCRNENEVILEYCPQGTGIAMV